MNRLSTLVNALIVVVLLAAVSAPFVLWWHFTKDDGPVAPPLGATQYDPSRIFNPSGDVLQVLIPDTTGDLRRARASVKGAGTFAGTATVVPTGDRPYAVVGIQSVDAGLLYEFRGRRSDRFALSVIEADGTTADAYYMASPLSFWELETKLTVGAGYDGTVVPFAGVSLVRVWGFHGGVTVGLSAETRDVLVGPHVLIKAYRSLTVGGAYDYNGGRVFLLLGMTF